MCVYKAVTVYDYVVVYLVRAIISLVGHIDSRQV